MPGKQNAKVGDLTVRVLREIRDEVRQLREETNTRLDQTNARLDGLVQHVDDGFAFLGGRIDNLLPGEHRQEHEELRGRVERIEQHLGLRSQ